MGSENLPESFFDSISYACQHISHARFAVFATPPVIQKILKENLKQVDFYPVSEAIEMDDEPIVALRQKKGSSMALGLRMLKKRQLDAFVSAGNTGALIAGAVLSLPKLPGIKRPALLATLPTEQGDVAVIDVGGNVSCKAEHLIQFAAMGAAYQRCCRGIDLPRVGLLNIGVESKKGTTELRKAYRLLEMKQNLRFQFIGNVEGRGVFQGHADVLITDGFTGNVLLKTSEGVSVFLLSQLKHIIQDMPLFQQEMIFTRLKGQFDYEEYSGAIVCGVDAVVVKCHGKSSARAFYHGIRGAAELVKNGFISQLKEQL